MCLGGHIMTGVAILEHSMDVLLGGKGHVCLEG